MRTLNLSLLTVIFSFVAGFAQQNSAAAKPNPCQSAEQRQLEFWVGEWNLTWPGQNGAQTGHGTNTVRRIMDGCVVQENFDGGSSMPLTGMSVSTFNNRIGKWQQTWVDNQGGYLDFVGEFKRGEMTLSREAKAPERPKIAAANGLQEYNRG